MTVTGQQFTIAADEHQVTVVEVGAGLRSYRYRGVDVTQGYPAEALPPKCAGVTLVPWPNRLRGGRYTFDGVPQQLALTEPASGNAIHGLGRWERWSVVHRDPAAVTLGLDIVPQHGWPYEVLVQVTYALHPDHGLTVTATARNHGSNRAPFGAGFHPYLSTHGGSLGETTVRLPASQRLIVDEAQLPIGVQSVAGTAYDLRRGRRLRELRMDDGFTGLHTEHGRGVAEVRNRNGGARLWFDEAFRYLQVFTPELLTGGRPAVAVEPMTCAPDAFNSGAGLIVLSPGGTWTGSWGISPL
jgi:aldose 1-epimerase